MKLTDDHKVQIFCSALKAVYPQEAPKPGEGGPMTTAGPVKKAGLLAAEAIALLQSKAWE
jgi:hypothetical protein